MLAALTSLRQKDAPAEAEAAPAAEKGSATLTSHPVASLAPPGADHKGKGPMAGSTSVATSPSSSTIGPPSSVSTRGEGTDRHLRRMTQDLVDILETMSGGAPPQQQQQQLRPPKGEEVQGDSHGRVPFDAQSGAEHSMVSPFLLAFLPATQACRGVQT